MNEIKISEQFITLQSLLKFANLVSSGGEAKIVILQEQVYVNGEVCTMRGKKIRRGDMVSYQGETISVI